MTLFPPGKCARCGGIVMERPDNLPLCSECEKKFTKHFAEKLRPDIGKKHKQELQSWAETEPDDG